MVWAWKQGVPPFGGSIVWAQEEVLGPVMSSLVWSLELPLLRCERPGMRQQHRPGAGRPALKSSGHLRPTLQAARLASTVSSLSPECYLVCKATE